MISSPRLSSRPCPVTRIPAADPFFRLWFRVVAPNRAGLLTASSAWRLRLLEKHWSNLVALAWEDLCRQRLVGLASDGPVGRLGPWSPPGRWWWKNAPEWDLVAESLGGKRLLVGEARWSRRPPGAATLRQAAREVQARALPALGKRYEDVVRVIFVPETRDAVRDVDGVRVVSGSDLLETH